MWCKSAGVDGRAHSSYVMIEIIFIVNEGIVLNFNVSLCMYNYIELLSSLNLKRISICVV